MWRAGLVAGLWVGQAFGLFLLLGLGVGSSSPQVLRHPTSMCDSGINDKGTTDLKTKKGTNNKYLFVLIKNNVMFCNVMSCYVC